MMTKFSRIFMIAAWTFLAAYLSSLTAADTAALIAKADSCIALMVAGQMDEALANVGYVEDATLKHLTPEMVARTSVTFKNLGVHGSERSSFELTNSELNTISYRLKIGGPSASSGTATPTTGFAFNAYRIDGHWYLSLKQ